MSLLEQRPDSQAFPPINGALLLTDFFEPDIAGQMFNDLEFRGDIPYDPKRRVFRGKDEYLDKLKSEDMELTAESLTALGTLASQKLGRIEFIYIDVRPPKIGLENSGYMPHRDTSIPPCASFVVVCSGTVEYSYSSKTGSRSIRRSMDTTQVADVGDVLALNNMSPVSGFRPLHQSRNGTGNRLVVNFVPGRAARIR